MPAEVDRITVNVSRKVRLGIGSEVILGANWSAKADPTQDVDEQTSDLLNAAFKDVNKLADHVERESTLST